MPKISVLFIVIKINSVDEPVSLLQEQESGFQALRFFLLVLSHAPRRQKTSSLCSEKVHSVDPQIQPSNEQGNPGTTNLNCQLFNSNGHGFMLFMQLPVGNLN